MILSQANYCKETMNLNTFSGFTFGYKKVEFSNKEQFLDFWKQVESLLILGPNTQGIALLECGFSPLEKV